MSEQPEDLKLAPENSSSVRIQIKDGGYTAVIFVPDGISDYPSLKQVHLAIESAGIKHGINDETIENLIRDRIKGKSIIFAKGDPPTEGSGPRFIWHENTGSQELERDITEEVVKADRAGHFFSRVSKGQQIVSKLPSEGGKTGTNVLGESVNIPDSDLSLAAGEGTFLSKDGLVVHADRSGVAVWAGNRVSVSDIQYFEGNVDTLNGNIKINGSVCIENDVCSGSSIDVLGDIFVGGNIENADVYSRKGSVIARSGIVGQGQARILAGRDVVAGFIQDATVGAKLDVYAGCYIINSAVSAGRDIIVTAAEGLIRGGTTFAERKIEVNVAGSEEYIETELKVGYTAPQHISRSRYQLRQDERQTRMELAYVQKRHSFLRLLKDRMGKLPKDKEEQLVELEERENILLSQRRDHEARELEIKNKADAMDGSKVVAETIRIYDIIHPNVSVSVGEKTYNVDKERRNLIFFRVGDELVFGPLSQGIAEGV